MAALAHHVPGKWVGHAVLSATFRHPSVLAKAATVLDHVTGGRFILGPRRRLVRAASTRRSGSRCRRCRSGSTASNRRSTSSARCSPTRRPRDAGRHPARPVLPARRRDQRPAAADARRPADLARRPEAPRDRARRGGRPGLAAPGGPRPTRRPSDMAYFSERHDALLARDGGHRPRPGGVRDRRPGARRAGPPRPRRARSTRPTTAVGLGATHVILGIAPSLGPAGVDAVAREVAEPLREAFG